MERGTKCSQPQVLMVDRRFGQMTYRPCAVDTSAMTVRPVVIDTSANVTDSSAIVGQDLIIRFISYI